MTSARPLLAVAAALASTLLGAACADAPGGSFTTPTDPAGDDPPVTYAAYGPDSTNPAVTVRFVKLNDDDTRETIILPLGQLDNITTRDIGDPNRDFDVWRLSFYRRIRADSLVTYEFKIRLSDWHESYRELMYGGSFRDPSTNLPTEVDDSQPDPDGRFPHVRIPFFIHQNGINLHRYRWANGLSDVVAQPYQTQPGDYDFELWHLTYRSVAPTGDISIFNGAIKLSEFHDAYHQMRSHGISVTVRRP